MVLLVLAACGGSGRDDVSDSPDAATTPDKNNNDNSAAFSGDAAAPGSGGNAEGRDPVDCNEAKTTHSYVGCDYWPTVTPNLVNPAFDFVAVVANTGANVADVTVTGPNGTGRKVTVDPGTLRKIYLPWAFDLKGTMYGSGSKRVQTLIAPSSAYHLVSTSPVIVYQFNPLEYERKGGEGPNGEPKQWPKCNVLLEGGCNSYSNDASLLLPSTAMTGNYRVIAIQGWKGKFVADSFTTVAYPPVLSITATAPQTTVKVQLSTTASVEASAKGATSPAFSSVNVSVAQLVGQGADESDFSGSIVQASSPVQVISSVQAIQVQSSTHTADHVEETVMPAETLGKQYVIATPTNFDATPGAQLVRLFGNKDNTTLTYSPAKPAGCPDKLGAGQVVDCGVVGDAFVVAGDAEFGVATFLLGGKHYKNNNSALGDPSQTTHPAIEQFRKNYVFLAPTDFPVLWADVTAPANTTLQLDGAAVTAPWTKIGDGQWGVFRLDLTKSGKDGAHTLTSSNPVAVQVLGYATYASFEYPAGLNLNLIAQPPPLK